jgi:hypothetical protein
VDRRAVAHRRERRLDGVAFDLRGAEVAVVAIAIVAIVALAVVAIVALVVALVVVALVVVALVVVAIVALAVVAIVAIVVVHIGRPPRPVVVPGPSLLARRRRAMAGLVYWRPLGSAQPAALPSTRRGRLAHADPAQLAGTR